MRLKDNVNFIKNKSIRNKQPKNKLNSFMKQNC
jgi:hypothetical protein